jgi:hypothetical protein
MRDLETFADAELAEVGTEGGVWLANGPVMTVAAAFMAGVAVASATVAAYEAGADGGSAKLPA